MAKIKIDSQLYDRAKKASQAAGYSNLEEFVVHLIETELSKRETGAEEANVAERLRGLGYIE